MILRNRKKSFTKKLFSFEALAICGIFVIVLFGFDLGKEYYRGYQIKKEIDSLKNDLSSLEKNNYELSKLIEYYKTDAYKESEARKKLNMKKEGEKVVIIKPSIVAATKSSINEKTEALENIPNYKKWWNYFFATKEK